MELGGDAEKRWWFTSAADFVLDVDETTRFRDSTEAAASAFTSHSLSLALNLAHHILLYLHETFTCTPLITVIIPSPVYIYKPSLTTTIRTVQRQRSSPLRAIGAICVQATSCYTAQPGIELHMADRLSFGSRRRSYCRR
jgi:hypothetical protein